MIQATSCENADQMMNPWRSLNFPIELNHVISHLNHWTRHCNGLIQPHQEIPSNQFFICQSYRFLKNKQLRESQISIDSQHWKEGPLMPHSELVLHFLNTFCRLLAHNMWKLQAKTQYLPTLSRHYLKPSVWNLQMPTGDFEKHQAIILMIFNFSFCSECKCLKNSVLKSRWLHIMGWLFVQKISIRFEIRLLDPLSVTFNSEWIPLNFLILGLWIIPTWTIP